MTKTAPRRTITCVECSAASAAGCGERRRDAKFCSIVCKTKWNNRRKARGADIYDLWMALRYERGEAKRLGLWGELCRLSEGWKDEDDRAERKTYEKPAVAIQRLKDRGAIRMGTVAGNFRALGVKR